MKDIFTGAKLQVLADQHKVPITVGDYFLSQQLTDVDDLLYVIENGLERTFQEKGKLKEVIATGLLGMGIEIPTDVEEGNHVDGPNEYGFWPGNSMYVALVSSEGTPLRVVLADGLSDTDSL